MHGLVVGGEEEKQDGPRAANSDEVGGESESAIAFVCAVGAGLP